ncbi:MAG: CoA transferase [Chloroflexi bacterium]|nr:CoA transferase [Chloroflexota bacterium]
MKLPLDGIRILANTYPWAGPFAMMMLADMGAEVILIESTQRWQWNTRGFMARPPKAAVETMGAMGGAYPNIDPGARPWNRHAMFNSHARNKKSFTIDLAKPEGVEEFKRLVAISDAVVENSTPGVMDRLGVGYESLRLVKPDIVMVSSSGMGAQGPYAGHRGFGSQMENLSGFSLLMAYPGGDPADTPLTNHSDAAGGAGIAFAVLAAIHYRSRTGKGQWVDMSQSENLIGQIPDAVMDYTMNGRVRASLGNRHPSMAPHGVYPCIDPNVLPGSDGSKRNGPADKWVAIAVANDEQWVALREAMGNPTWAQDSKFDSSLGRWSNQDELDAEIAKWTKRHLAREIMNLLQSKGIAAGELTQEGEFSADPQLWSRNFFRMVHHAEAGSHLYPGPMWYFSQAPVEFRLPPVRMGEHNEYVYKELLGVEDAQYRKLEAEGHIGMDFAPHVT